MKKKIISALQAHQQKNCPGIPVDASFRDDDPIVAVLTAIVAAMPDKQKANIEAALDKLEKE